MCVLEGKAACAKTHVAPLHIGGTGRGLQAQPERCFAAPGMNEPLSSRLCEPLCVQVPLTQPQPHVEKGERPEKPKLHSPSDFRMK